MVEERKGNNLLRVVSYVNGRVVRKFLGEDFYRTEISTKDGSVVIGKNSDLVALQTGNYGHMLVLGRNGYIKSFIEITKDPRENRYSFHFDGEQIGVALGENFDLALANQLDQRDALLASESRGSIVHDRVVDHVRTTMRSKL